MRGVDHLPQPGASVLGVRILAVAGDRFPEACLERSTPRFQTPLRERDRYNRLDKRFAGLHPPPLLLSPNCYASIDINVAQVVLAEEFPSASIQSKRTLLHEEPATKDRLRFPGIGGRRHGFADCHRVEDVFPAARVARGWVRDGQRSCASASFTAMDKKPSSSLPERDFVLSRPSSVSGRESTTLPVPARLVTQSGSPFDIRSEKRGSA